jgi:hypothetical protein
MKAVTKDAAKAAIETTGDEAMSQHYLDTQTKDGQSVTVLMGWDRPLQFVPCSVLIDRQDDFSPTGEILYSNLDEGIPFTHRVELSYYTTILAERFGITLPNEMLGAITADIASNAGNRVEYYEEKQTRRP